MLDGILPGQGGVEEREVKLPESIPDDFIAIRSPDDVDTFPRGGIAHLMVWDEEIALDLLVAGAALTVIDRSLLDQEPDMEAEDFAVLDEEGLWLPGVDRPYVQGDGAWIAPDEEE